MVLTIDRGEYYQAGMVIRKGGFDDLHSAGLAALRASIAEIAPVLTPVVGALTDWDQVKLLAVRLDRLDRWHRDGFIAIGDAAHAMSPVGGVGVNYAIQDAVALANAITDELRRGGVSSATLHRVQRRRAAPVRIMQRIQRAAHAGITRRTASGRFLPRGVVTALRFASPVVRRLIARLIGLGIRPEHVRPSSNSRR
ncbi:FAD-dependent monooxygenase [Microbacterium sp. HD4P20]|uniref:FAD-dependent monooxygenase n=1 Tax=Microbacterium sp. HD4P20 TaxID=2864874 RepID=UPI0020A3474F|nr:FAD-dependent monooxygenase [Microbacterium sp. HD4P20]MCP2636893.1 FAD-dependent monooxygenase [Microbacterium sp. HD4P20]